jgi:hypothetical protein
MREGAMNKNSRIVAVFIILAIVAVIGLYVLQDLWRSSSKMIVCDDGERRTIDIRDFIQQYSAHSVEFEATFADKGRFRGKLDPVVIQKISDSLQQANESRKFIVAGYNSCAISKAQFAEFVVSFQEADKLTKQIDELTTKPRLTEEEQQRVREITAAISKAVGITSKFLF